MKQNKHKPRDRSPDATIMAVSLPKSLLAEIDRAAKADNRTRSNYVVTALSKLLADKLQPDKTDTR